MTADDYRALRAAHEQRMAHVSPLMQRIQMANTMLFVRQALLLEEVVVAVRHDGTLLFGIGNHVHEWVL